MNNLGSFTQPTPAGHDSPESVVTMLRNTHINGEGAGAWLLPLQRLTTTAYPLRVLQVTGDEVIKIETRIDPPRCCRRAALGPMPW